MHNSADQIDFVTALGRLLARADLRDRFRTNPRAAAHELRLRPQDLNAFCALSTDGLEAQSAILLRKRWSAARELIPVTAEQLGSEAWPLFQRYARSVWTADPSTDARQFLLFLRAQGQPTNRAENLRAAFRVSGSRWSLSFAAQPVRGRTRLGLLWLCRTRGGLIRERFFYLAR